MRNVRHLIAAALLAGTVVAAPTSASAAACDPPVTNRVACENTLAGNPPSEWDEPGAGDPSIQGFATDISVNRGDTVRFKVNTTAGAYRIDLYRLGYYGGLGARKVATVTPSVALPQTQPACATDASSGLVDCGRWAESASWPVPADAVSGVYLGHLVRPDTGGGSHIVFVVRDDASTSALLFQTSDTTWQAYNTYGGNSLYVGQPAGRAYKVSYNRPITTRGTSPEDFLFDSEYPMLRWLEANGYDVSYTTGVDTDRRGGLLTQHRTFLSVGHDEYWSGTQRANVEAARAAGVHLGFFSGNEVFWKTRWETSIDGSGTPHRTLVSYKETHANASIDPADPPTWTGTWRDARFSPPADGGRPENALTGTIFMVNGTRNDSIVVPAEDGKMRFWRNTAVASLGAGQSATLPVGTLGYEWDVDQDNGFRPPGLVRLSTATYALSSQLLLDNGSTYGAGSATHHLTLYRAPSGALVFGAGTVRWSWGLDSTHDGSGAAPNTSMRQATVNLLADMGVQPGTLQAGLSAATASSDSSAPTSVIASPGAGATLPAGQPVTVSGTAADAGGGAVGGVEVSVDGGATWHPATGRSAWTYTFTPGVSGPLTIKSRAADDSANLEVPGAGVSVTIGGGAPPPDGQTLWSPTTTPTTPADSDTAAVELGVKFRSDVNGFITGVRFYKGSGNTGTHVGSLWTTGGTRLATGTFTGETAGGWQQLLFSSPVAITANTTYVASYHAPNGHYAVDDDYFAVQGRDNPPLHAPPTSSTPNGVYRYGASAFPTETYRASNYWVDVVFKTSIASDTTPPSIVDRSPAAGATGTPLTGVVSARFSEAIQPGSVTVTLRNSSGATVSGTTAYDAATTTATFTPASPLVASSTYTATVSGAVDLAGNLMGAPVSWAFTTGSSAPPGSAVSLWSASTTPGTAAANDTGSVELGVKLRSDVAGLVTGLRFYRGPGNDGTHIGNLWSATGTRLATATFTGESATGWQQVSFPSPVPMAADTIFVASYFAPVGRYAVDPGYFAATGADNAPLHALANATSANGVYRYGATSGFPQDSYQASNYWVDVVFAPSGPDTFPPTVTATTPAAGAVSVAVGAALSATFGEAVQPSTVSFVLTDAANRVVPSTVTHDASTNRSVLTPAAALAPQASYTATVSGALDLAGNAMAAPFSWSFVTGAGSLPPVGPGGPILVVTNGANAFSSYLAEILRSEGLNEWAAADLGTVSSSMLAGYDVVLLGETALTSAQVSMFDAWVAAGGNLIAMRPDKQLAGLLGLADAGSTLANAYLRVDTATPSGAGITDQTIQFHGTADRYTLSGAAAVAQLYATSTSPTANPAVTLRSVGPNGGQAAAFTYDLARSVVYTRQGNPAWAGQERDGQNPRRSDDLFFGAAAGDVQPDWVDLDKVAIPQADEQQRLLVKLLEQMNQDRKPLPRFWYLPNGAKAAVFLSGDDHGTGGTAGRFNQLIAASPPGCVVANWGCPRMTSYLYPGTPLTDAQAATYVAQGFEIGTHVNTGCDNWTPASLAATFSQQIGALAAQLPSIPRSPSQRIHCIVWSDWATAPWTELAQGIRLDADYYYWPPGWVNDRPGFFTGSGMPMRFADLDGSTIDVYQAATQMTDESGQTFPFTIDRLLDNAIGPLGYYGVFTANMHTDQASSAGSDAILASAAARGVPVISGRQLLTWLDGRNSSSFGGITWGSGNLAFSIAAGAGATNLQAMVPQQSSAGLLQAITRSGASVPFSIQTIKGTSYAFFAATAGSYVAQYSTSSDTTAPTISNVASSVTASSATITWTTDEASSSVVDFGTAAGSLTSSASSAGMVTTHSVNLTGLSSNATYYFRVRSADGAANAAVAPPLADSPLSFTTLGTVADTTAAHFAGGSLGTATYVAQTNDGEVSLAPTVGAEFSGTTLPSGWTASTLQSGGTTTVANGSVTVNGTQVRTSTSYGNNRSLEFVATFTALNQRAGLSTDFSTRPWARFEVRNSSQLLVSTGVSGSTNRSTNLSGGLVGAPHRFRIDWNTSSVVYSVDGVVVATHNVSPGGTMRPFVGDGTAGGGGLALSWMRLTPYPASGTFTSRVLDAGRVTTWRTASWLSSTPAGTGITIRVRSGNTATPDATWTAYTAVGASGAAINKAGRYLQYEAVLTSSSNRQTPELQQVAFAFG